MLNTYVLLMAAVVLFPILLSFEKRVHFVRNWPITLLSAVIVAVPYLVWDAFEAYYGVWGFNTQYAGTYFFYYLPIGEYFFFIFVPFACIFIYEVSLYYFKPRQFNIPSIIFVLASVVSSILALVWHEKAYTLKAFGCLAVFLLILAFTKIRNHKHFYLYLGISYIPFIIVNGILTGLPIVTYNNEENLFVRLGSIPLEDFFYNLSLLGFVGLIYIKIKEKRDSIVAKRASRVESEQSN